jgi:hypothetical protein
MRRSRCERQLLKLLRKSFPDLRMLPNDRKLIGAEVDIAIPAIDLAIEWNGIVHHKPIYGQETLDRTQRQDCRKKSLAKQAGVELVVVDDLKSTEDFVRQSGRELRKLIRKRMKAAGKG